MLLCLFLRYRFLLLGLIFLGLFFLGVVLLFLFQTGKVIIHHYIYDEEDNKYTKAKLVEDEEIEKEIGEEYETKPSSKIPANYADFSGSIFPGSCTSIFISVSPM